LSQPFRIKNDLEIAGSLFAYNSELGGSVNSGPIGQPFRTSGDVETEGTFETSGSLSVGPEFGPVKTLFGNNEPGFVFLADPDTCFTDLAGTTKAQVGQAVALWLDQSRGLKLGPELVTNGTFDVDTSGWTAANAVLSVENQRLKVQNTTTAAGQARTTVATVVGRTYQIEFTAFPVGTTNCNIRIGTTVGGTDILNTIYTTETSESLLVSATVTTLHITVRVNSTSSNASVFADNISVRELPGFHATQATLANRPILGRKPKGGRRNLLTFTEQFDNAAWTKTGVTVAANAAVDPDGTQTAQKITENTAVSSHFVYRTGFAVVSGTEYTFTAFMRAAEKNIGFLGCFDGSRDFGVSFNLSTGSVSGNRVGGVASAVNSSSISPAGGGWFKCSITFTATTTATSNFWAQIGILNISGDWASNGYTGDGTSGIFIWGAQLELGSTATDYQRVTTRFDVTEAGKADCHYLFCGGAADPRWMQTPTITPGTDKVQVFAAVRKLSDAATGIVVETGTGSGGNFGAFSLLGPTSAGANNYLYQQRGDGTNRQLLTFAPSPITNAITCLGDISAPFSVLRLNGDQKAINTDSQGSGNFLAYPTFIGARGGTSFYFNGEISALTSRFGPNLTTPIIRQMEQFTADYVAERTI
jgi:hypothetical protein